MHCTSPFYDLSLPAHITGCREFTNELDCNNTGDGFECYWFTKTLTDVDFAGDLAFRNILYKEFYFTQFRIFHFSLFSLSVALHSKNTHFTLHCTLFSMSLSSLSHLLICHRFCVPLCLTDLEVGMCSVALALSEILTSHSSHLAPLSVHPLSLITLHYITLSLHSLSYLISYCTPVFVVDASASVYTSAGRTDANIANQIAYIQTGVCSRLSVAGLEFFLFMLHQLSTHCTPLQ